MRQAHAHRPEQVAAPVILILHRAGNDQAAILVLLALAGVFVLIVHDLLPEDTLGPAKFIVEGSVAITAATLLVALTDGVESPFFFVYPLIVGGAALVVPPRVTLGLLAIATGGYVLAVAVGSPAARLSDPAVAATVGINLTAADYVIHMDPWWNPAVEDQASDRAHRMGQQRPVTIYRLVARHTIEEGIVDLHQHKRELADSLLDGSDGAARMSAEDMLAMLSEGLRR